MKIIQFTYVSNGDGSNLTLPTIESLKKKVSIYYFIFVWTQASIKLIILMTLRLSLFRRKIFSTVKYLQKQMISGKIIVFPVFDCILENSLKNILQCLEQCKMKKKKKKKKRNPLQSANPLPQSTDNQPQTTITANPANPQTSKPTNPANPQTHHHSTFELESHRVALNHELIINCLVGSGSGAASIAKRSDLSSSPTAPPSTMSPTSSLTHH